MWIKKLDISHLRNICQASLIFNEHSNFIVGNNGSGKSSILEALHCLSSGQSFRTNKSLPIVSRGSESSVIYGEVVDGHNTRKVGIKRSISDSTLLKLDGSSQVGQAELALVTPLVGITPEAEDLLEGSSKVRVSFIDWSLFHVEPSFRTVWRDYKRILKQRNSALRARRSKGEICLWDAQLAENGEVLTRMRTEVLAMLVPLIQTHIELFLPKIPVQISYKQGWNRESAFKDALSASFETDSKMGFTHLGPHRADLTIRVEGKPVAQSLSRGQRKLIVIALRLGQIEDFIRRTGNKPSIYIDDLPAELDRNSRKKVLKALHDLNVQAFVSATSSEELPELLQAGGTVFHVEQGVVSNVV